MRSTVCINEASDKWLDVEETAEPFTQGDYLLKRCQNLWNVGIYLGFCESFAENWT